MEGILWTIPEDFSQENATDESVQIVETALTAGGNDGKFFGGGLLGGGGTVYYDGGRNFPDELLQNDVRPDDRREHCQPRSH